MEMNNNFKFNLLTGVVVALITLIIIFTRISDIKKESHEERRTTVTQ